MMNRANTVLLHIGALAYALALASCASDPPKFDAATTEEETDDVEEQVTDSVDAGTASPLSDENAAASGVSGDSAQQSEATAGTAGEDADDAMESDSVSASDADSMSGTSMEASMGSASADGACEPGVVRCSPTQAAVQECSLTGEWLLRSLCEGDSPICARGACVQCEPDELACDANSLMRCSDDGAWELEEACSGGTVCREQTQSCGTCSEGETQCGNDTTLSVCADGQFIDESCPSELPVCVLGECLECDPATSVPYCDNGAPVDCVDGLWAAQTACGGATSVCNELTAECVSCAQGETQCTQEGLLATCDDYGQWNPAPCPSDSPMCLDDECVACDPDTDEPRCSDNAVETCSSSGRWVQSVACSANTPTCIEALGACGSCEQGDTQCSSDGTAVGVCNDQGQFVDSPCSGSTPVCANGECVECSDAAGPQAQCAGNTPQICASNEWVSQAACSGDTPVCDPDTGDCVCDDGSVRCQGSSLQECTGGAWTELDNCSGEYPICDETAGRCVCSEGASECQPGDLSRIRRCEDGSWFDQECPSTGPVCYEDECVECDPTAAPTCEPDGLRVWCSASAREQEEQCDFLCNDGECRDTRTENGSFTCSVADGIVCSSPQICCKENTPKCVTSEDDCGKVSPGSAYSASTVRCDNQGDCGNDPNSVVCCLHTTGGTTAERTECTPTEECSGGAMGYYR